MALLSRSLGRRSVLRLGAQLLALLTLAHGPSLSLAQSDFEPPVKGLKPLSDNKELAWRRMPLDPGYYISSRFGQDFGRGPHRGVDLAGVPVGTPIYAPADGTVVEFVNSWNEEYQDKSFGHAVCLDHVGTPWYSLYAHMSGAPKVRVGDKVKAGQMIGRLGYSGVVLPKGTGGAHLHWQVCKTASFPVDISYSADPLGFRFTSEEEIDMTVDDMKKLIKEVLDERKMEVNFADSMTRRIKGIHDATKPGTELADQLAGIHEATDLNNLAFVA